MKTILWSIAVCAAVLVGYNVPRKAEESQAHVELQANELACERRAPLGYTAYPITKLGELRGCLFVNQDNPDVQRVERRVAL